MNTWQERILDDGTDRSTFAAAHRPVISASFAATLAKAESVEKYLAAKLKTNDFGGNEWTRSGHKWEADMLAWSGLPGNTALVHAVDEVGFASTVDGLSVDGKLGAECKAKHDRIVFGPAKGEWRQLAWQFRTIAELEQIQFIWVEIVNGQLRTDEPNALIITRDHPEIVKAIAQVEPIAHDVLRRLRVALEFEQELLAS